MKTTSFYIIVHLFLCPCLLSQIYINELEQQLPFEISDIVFVNHSTGWLIEENGGHVWSTLNGGENWTICSSFGFTLEPRIHFWDTKRGMVFGKKGEIFLSFDGGYRWVEKSQKHIINGLLTKKEPNKPRITFTSGYFFSKGHVLVSGIMEIPKKNKTLNHHSFIIKSLDYGGSWEILSGEIMNGFVGLYFWDLNHGFGLDRKTLYQTEDGGRKWEKVPINNCNEDHFFETTYCKTPEDVFVLTADGNVLQSIDRGKTWRFMRLAKEHLRGLIFLDKEVGLIVGDKNEEQHSMFYTFNGGDYWLLSNMETEDLFRVYQFDQDIWLVGKKGWLYQNKLNTLREQIYFEKLVLAVRKLDYKMILKYVNNVNINHQDDAGWSLLHWWNFPYEQEQNGSVLNLLVSLGIDVNLKDKFGRNSLAIYLNPGEDQFEPQAAIIRKFIALGADLTSTDRDGVSPLMLGLESSNRDIRNIFEQSHPLLGYGNDNSIERQ